LLTRIHDSSVKPYVKRQWKKLTLQYQRKFSAIKFGQSKEKKWDVEPSSKFSSEEFNCSIERFGCGTD
jgi:hypothetical protein